MNDVANLTSVIHAVVSNISDGVILVNALGRVIYHNKSATELLDLGEIENLSDIDERTGINFPRLISSQDSSTLPASPDDSATADTLHFEQDIVRKNGEQRLEFNVSHLDLPQLSDPLQLVVVNDCTKSQRLDTLISRSAKHELITKNSHMQQIINTLSQVAPTRATVLLQGESGTGKSMFARIIHENSSRAAKPFIKLNCAAIPETLLESELFGHVKGSFTGALKDRAGRFQSADGGTLFLDEISEIPLHLQPKLLTALEEQQFHMVGSDELTKVDIRVIAASNQDLEQLVSEGKFRADLYYRLGVFNLEVPALRKRKDDIPLLIDHLCDTLVARGYPERLHCTEEAMGLMIDYPWPGNIRELANAVEHAMILARNGVVSSDCLPRSVREYRTAEPSGYADSDTSLEAQRSEITNALDEANGNRAEAARILGIDRSTLWRRLHRLGLA